MAESLKFIATTDRYEDCELGPNQLGRFITFSVSTNPFLYELATLSLANNPVWNGPDIPSQPVQGAGFTGPPYPCGIRFKSANPGQSAVVIATLWDSNDPQPIAGIVLSDTFTPSGDVVPGTGLTGDIVWSGATSRAGAIFCNGQAVSRATYSTLFGVIGTTFGAGDGSTTFNVPDLRDRAPIGAGGNTALAGNEGVAAGSRVALSHHHTILVQGNAINLTPGATGYTMWPTDNPQPFKTTSGGTPIDSPPFLGLNPFILT